MGCDYDVVESVADPIGVVVIGLVIGLPDARYGVAERWGLRQFGKQLPFILIAASLDRFPLELDAYAEHVVVLHEPQ